MKLSCFAVATILSGLFATSVNFPAKTLAQARREPFPLVGGVTLGKLEYASFATSPEQPLEAAIHSAIKRDFPEWSLNNSSPVTYSYVKKDINGDGRADAFVYINNSIGSGSGGLHVWIFQANSSGYQLVGRFLHTWALVINARKTSGWNEILVVPGKINRYPDSFYSTCRFDPNRSVWSGNSDSLLGKYGDCREIQRNAVISGILISAVNPVGGKPAFRLDP
jgi:hypothetical protein